MNLFHSTNDFVYNVYWPYYIIIVAIIIGTLYINAITVLYIVILCGIVVLIWSTEKIMSVWANTSVECYWLVRSITINIFVNHK